MLFQKKNPDLLQQKLQLEALQEKYRLSEEARAGLETRLTNLLEFIRMIAHNLNGPVGNMGQILEVIPQLPPGEEQDEYISLLEPTVSSLQTALDELRMVVDIQSKSSVELTDCSIEEIFKRVQQRVHNAATARQIFISASFQEKTIHYSQSYLENIIYDLLNYTLTHAKPGRAPTIRVTTSREAGRTVLRVESNHMAINPDKELAQLFKYKKVTPSAGADKKMGLFLVRNQIETLGGQITATSQPGQGLVFTILF